MFFDQSVIEKLVIEILKSDKVQLCFTVVDTLR